MAQKKQKKQKKKEKKKEKKKHDVALSEPVVASDEPIKRRDEAGGALVAALQEAARLGVRVAVDGDGYTILHGREEGRRGKANLSGVVVRRTAARRERAAATGAAQRR